MHLILALGNKGEKYEYTRHNVGWIVIDEIFGKHDWEYDKYADADILKIEIKDQPVIVAKPQTFMNRSGITAKYLMKQYEIAPDHLIVIHDDCDIAVGDFRISYDRGSANHHGVDSVTDQIQTREYTRIRMGIGQRGTLSLSDYVLMPMPPQEIEVVRNLDKEVREALEMIITRGPAYAQNSFN